MLQHYLERFRKLHTDKGKTWDERTKLCAPHKPLLLLSMLDRFAEGAYPTNLIEFDDDLSDIFAIYWALVDPPSKRGNIAMPLCHLRRDKFWHLLSRPNFEERVKHTARIHSIHRLRRWTFGARLDDELYALLQEQKSRDELRVVLIDTYFGVGIRPKLLKQAGINLESYFYSQELLAKVKGFSVKETTPSVDTYQVVRDQAFKLTVRKIYDHHCSVCDVRILTAEGYTAVIGAHIIPWSISHNDDPRNGVALCPLCHWIFDEGLITITPEYKIRTSPQLHAFGNNLEHLKKINKQPILLPEDSDFYPSFISLTYHTEEIYRKR